MRSSCELNALVDLVSWIDQNTSGISLPTDERTTLAVGCLDVAIEHQAAIAILGEAQLYGSAFALLRVQAESLVRGLWLLHCATESELSDFRKGILEKHFATLIREFESVVGTPNGVLSKFKLTAWKALNSFTHTGFHQVSRRHNRGRIEGCYPDSEVKDAYGITGALGLVAAGQIIGLSDRYDLLLAYEARMEQYAAAMA